MGTFNRIRTAVRCPRCGHHGECKINLYFGYTSEMRTVALGERYPGLEPGAGEQVLRGVAYAECGQCWRDFYCKAILHGDVLHQLTPDLDEPPISPDVKDEGAHPCFVCGSQRTELWQYGRMLVGRLRCEACDTEQYVRWRLDGSLEVIVPEDLDDHHHRDERCVHPCLDCASTQTILQRIDWMRVGRLRCDACSRVRDVLIALDGGLRILE